MTRECPSCGRQNPTDRDFCECGEYLAWDPTRMQLPAVPKPADAAVPPPSDPPAAAVPAPTEPIAEQPPAGVPAPDPATIAGVMPAVAPVAPVVNDSLAVDVEHGGSASLQLLSPGGDPVEVPDVQTAAGASAMLLGMVRNQSAIVDNYDVEVRGVPAEWVVVSPPTLYLIPYGSSGTYEETVRIELRPPRSPEALAQAWPLEVAVRSRALGAIVARERATLHIEPFHELALELTPKRAAGRRAARLKAVVRNRGNAPAALVLAGQDTDDACELRWADPNVTVPPGRALEAPLKAIPRKQLWIGRPVDRQLEVTATATGGDRAAATAIGTVRQKPWLPWWLLIVIPLLIALAILLWTMRPDNVTVPDLRGKPGGLDAQKTIEAAGLKLSPKSEPRIDPKQTPGTVVDQSPEANSEAEKGSLVTLAIAVGTGEVTVPKLVGLNLAAADAALRQAGLAMGGVQPAAPADDKAKISYQLPRAGEKVREGTPIAIVFPGPKAAKKPGAKAPAGGAAPAPAAGGGGGEDVEVPAIAGKKVADALAELTKAGLAPEVSTRAATAPKDEVISVTPKAGTKVKAATSVKVVVSGGLPALLYDDGARVLRLRLDRPGAKPTEVVPNGRQPAWSPGRRVVVVSGGKLVMLGAQPVVLTTSGDYHDPSWSPAGDGVLAAIRLTNGVGELCIGRVGPASYTPSCAPAPGWKLTNQLRWSDDATKLLAIGVSAASAQRFGLIEFSSKVPNSSTRRDWGDGKVTTSTAAPGRGVIAAEISPDGKRVAAASNLNGTGGFGLVLGDASDLSLAKAKRLNVRACDVAWRPDGRELLVVQSDAGCSQPVGDLVRLDPANPTRTTVVRQGVENPAWEPVAGGG